MHNKTENLIDDPFPLEKVEAWLFDLDGTLMDTDDQTVERLARRLRFFLGPRRAKRLARRAVMFSETPLNDVVTMLDVVGLDPLFFYLRQRLSLRELPLFPQVPGVGPLLRHLAKFWPLAVVTTRSQSAADTFLEQHDLRPCFSLVVTRETTQRLKPHPAPVLHAATELRVPVGRCVMVGDTPVDVVSARRAGAWAVGVLCGFGEEDELQRTGAHLVLPSTADLLPLVKAEESLYSKPHRRSQKDEFTDEAV